MTPASPTASLPAPTPLTQALRDGLSHPPPQLPSLPQACLCSRPPPLAPQPWCALPPGPALHPLVGLTLPLRRLPPRRSPCPSAPPHPLRRHPSLNQRTPHTRLLLQPWPPPALAPLAHRLPPRQPPPCRTGLPALPPRGCTLQLRTVCWPWSRNWLPYVWPSTGSPRRSTPYALGPPCHPLPSLPHHHGHLPHRPPRCRLLPHQRPRRHPHPPWPDRPPVLPPWLLLPRLLAHRMGRSRRHGRLPHPGPHGAPQHCTATPCPPTPRSPATGTHLPPRPLPRPPDGPRLARCICYAWLDTGQLSFTAAPSPALLAPRAHRPSPSPLPGCCPGSRCRLLHHAPAHPWSPPAAVDPFQHLPPHLDCHRLYSHLHG